MCVFWHPFVWGMASFRDDCVGFVWSEVPWRLIWLGSICVRGFLYHSSVLCLRGCRLLLGPSF